MEKNTIGIENIQNEGNALLYMLRMLGSEEQRIAYAVLEGMHLQKRIEEQRKEVQSI